MITKHRKINSEKYTKEENNSTNFRKILGVVLLHAILLASCTVNTRVIPQPSTTTEPTATPLSEVDQQATATAQAQAEEEAKQAEKERIINEANNSFTYEQLNAYLAKNGTGWEDGIEPMVNRFDGKNMKNPFLYFFIKNNREKSADLIYPTPFISMRYTLKEINNGSGPEVVDEIMISRITESIYIDLYPPNNGNERERLWEDVGGKYKVIMYLSEEMCEDGVLRDIARLNIGGYFIYDEKSMVEYISPEKAKSYNFSEEELTLIEKGYTTLIHIPYKDVIGAGRSEKGLPDDGS